MKLESPQGACHMEVRHALPGRLRLWFQVPLPRWETAFTSLQGVRSCTYNPTLRTMLVQYDSALGQEAMLMNLAAAYARVSGAPLIHVRHREDGEGQVESSAALSLGTIVLNGALTLTGSTYAPFSGYLAMASTLGAVISHGYHELRARGTFDPEVMSLVYLLNALGRTDTFRPCLVAWLLTFGRHLLPRTPQETAYLTRMDGEEMVMTRIRWSNRQETMEALFRGGIRMISRNPQMAT